VHTSSVRAVPSSAGETAFDLITHSRWQAPVQLTVISPSSTLCSSFWSHFRGVMVRGAAPYVRLRLAAQHFERHIETLFERRYECGETSSSSDMVPQPFRCVSQNVASERAEQGYGAFRNLRTWRLFQRLIKYLKPLLSSTDSKRSKLFCFRSLFPGLVSGRSFHTVQYHSSLLPYPDEIPRSWIAPWYQWKPTLGGRTPQTNLAQ
jgi:hypothetical protein